MDKPRNTPRSDKAQADAEDSWNRFRESDWPAFAPVGFDLMRALEIETQELAEALEKLLSPRSGNSDTQHGRWLLARHRAKQEVGR